MEGPNHNRGNIYKMRLLERTGVQIESFPVVNLPQTEAVIKEKPRPLRKKKVTKPSFTKPIQKPKLLTTSLPMVNSAAHLRIRPISDYRYDRNFQKPVNDAASVRNTHAQLSKRKTRDEPNVFKELYRISFPCFSGCATCAFTQCFGPVRVYISQFKQPKPAFADEIRDGQGRKIIPRDRRREFRGLVYDRDTNSLYPPLPKGYTSIYLNTERKPRIIY